MSLKEFAEHICVNPKTLENWKYRLRRGGVVAGSVGSKMADVLPFVEVTAQEREPFEVVMPSGLRLRVPTEFDDEAFRRLLQAVR